MKTQREIILEHLQTAPITPIIALNRYGCFRLASRIDELRKQGHQISTQKRRLASGKTVAVYRLQKK